MKTFKLLNNFLNAHLECIDHGIALWHITGTLAESPEFTENYSHWPFMISDDDSPLSPEALARITFLYIDDPAWDFGTDYLLDLPNLRELQLQSFGSIDLGFLRKLPNLKVLHLKCEEIYDETPLLALKQLTHLSLDYDRPHISLLKRLPELERVYFQQASFEQVHDFLLAHPGCLVHFIDAEYRVYFFAEFSLGMPFRYYSTVKDDQLTTAVFPLEEGDLLSDELSPEEQQEFLCCAAPLLDLVLSEFNRRDNCSFGPSRRHLGDGYEFTWQFQRLLLPAFREELEEAPRKLEELFAAEVDFDRAEWWLLKYSELKTEILRQIPGCPLPPSEDSPFTYAHSAETSFLEAYRKLDNCMQLWRWRSDCEALQQQLAPLEGVDFYRRYNALGRNLNCELLYPLWDLDILDGSKEIRLCLSGYDLELKFPWEAFAAALELSKKLRRMGV